MNKICGHELSVLKYALNRATSLHGWPKLNTPDLRIKFLETCLLTITENQGGELSIVGRDRSTASHIVAGARLNAWQDLHDPDKLAAIIGETLRWFGVESDVWHPNDSASISLRFTNEHFRRSLTLTVARAMLLRLLQLPEGATTADALREVETS